MLNENILNRIEKVNSIQDFNNLLSIFEASTAEIKIKDEAIRTLKAKKSCFYINPLHTPKNVYEDIIAGQADIDDIK